ncbi:sigma factor-like helix-turn-helix DNA-binding protein [Nocardia sp. NPDC059240]|uniref:sigma factor-like helix-turn-helix DNA-binding protein n=1 Tax=Nocardia sp. NPDC059240 TaxID=3346786 RepID=UPI0036B8DDC6
MPSTDELDQLRDDPDPLRRAKLATELMNVYQQRAAELALMRKEAIEEAHDMGLEYQEIAARLGITKGRISQIRSTAPRSEQP